jgi:hypothetical protein
MHCQGAAPPPFSGTQSKPPETTSAVTLLALPAKALQQRASQTSCGAGEGNRTLVISLEGFCSTIELHPPARRPSPCRPISPLGGVTRAAAEQEPDSGGGGWIRTNVGVSQQIYSLPPLAARAPLRLRREPQIIFVQHRVVKLRPARRVFHIPVAAPASSTGSTIETLRPNTRRFRPCARRRLLRAEFSPFQEPDPS